MTDFEWQVDDAIVAWYQSEYVFLSDYFNTRNWTELFDEQKQTAARLFWEEKLS